MPFLGWERKSASSFFYLIQPAQQSLSAQTQTAPAETLFVDLGSAVRRAIHLSPEVMAVASKRDFATARWDLARSSRFLPEFKVNTAHSLAPGLKGIGDTPTDLLYLDPDVRNDWDQLSMFNRVEAEAIQPVYTWGQLSGSIQAAMQGVSVESEGLRAKEADIALRTGELYTSVLLAEELFRLTGRIGEVLNQAKREIQRLLDDGAEDVDDADLFQVQLSELEFQRRVVEVTEQRKTANMALRRQLLVHDDIVIVAKEATLTPLPLTLDSLSVYFDHAMENRPELAQAKAGLLARQAADKGSRVRFVPEIISWVLCEPVRRRGKVSAANPLFGRSFCEPIFAGRLRHSAEPELSADPRKGRAGPGRKKRSEISGRSSRASGFVRSRRSLSEFLKFSRLHWKPRTSLCV